MPFLWRRQPVLRVLITSQLTAQPCQNQATNEAPSLAIWSAKQTRGHTERNFHNKEKERDTLERGGEQSSDWDREKASPWLPRDGEQQRFANATAPCSEVPGAKDRCSAGRATATEAARLMIAKEG